MRSLLSRHVSLSVVEPWHAALLLQYPQLVIVERFSGQVTVQRLLSLLSLI